MTDATEWRGQTGASWATEWRRTDRSFMPLTDRLLARTREFAFGPVLDIGCGAGELSLALARGRRRTHVTGIDISPHLVNVARERAANLANVAFEVADAAVWEPVGTAPELLISRHGVMFFDDPVAAFANLSRIAAPGAGLLFSCFRSAAESPFFSEVARLLPDAPAPADPLAPGPFAFADPQRVEAILTASGWTGIAFERFDFAAVVGGGTDPIEDAVEYFSSIGPAARAARAMSADERKRFFDRVRKLAVCNDHDGLVSLRAGAWIVTARRVDT